MKCSTLVISGGSVKGVGVLGALLYLRQRTPLTEITHFYGTSCGAILCVFIALGFSVEELLLLFLVYEFSFAIECSLKNLQLLDYAGLISFFREAIITRCGREPTLGELATREGKFVHIISYNYSRAKLALLSAETRPDMLCTDAIRLSCALPFVFGKTIHEGELYVDGGVVCNFPLEFAVQHGARDIVAFNIISPRAPISAPEKEIVMSLFFNLIFAPIDRLTQMAIERYQTQCILVQLPITVPLTQFKLSAGDTISLFCQGYAVARKCLP